MGVSLGICDDIDNVCKGSSRVPRRGENKPSLVTWEGVSLQKHPRLRTEANEINQQGIPNKDWVWYGHGTGHFMGQRHSRAKYGVGTTNSGIVPQPGAPIFGGVYARIRKLRKGCEMVAAEVVTTSDFRLIKLR
ncbi:hypothetical protein Syun_014442 [Stephania yunnanensis]|uniref:Uncharacterized protein n=1 Tax=Stephania yunnanensis TaxID=152371 RepID=A0AAP0P8S4_9MAGN